MEVELRVTFIIESADGEEMTENDAKSAASLAAWNNLVLTRNGRDIAGSVRVHVDGLGQCDVTVGDGHE